MPPAKSSRRARVVTLIQRKGGAGKSTLAVNLAAVAGENNPPPGPDSDAPVVAAGTDPQGSLDEWAQRVPEEKLPFDYVITRGKLGVIPELVQDPNVARVYIDTPGFVDTDIDAELDADPLGSGPAAEAMKEVLQETDLALVPISPDFLTHSPAEFTIERVLKPRGVKFMVVINIWDSGEDPKKTELKALREWCVNHDYPFVHHAIRRYKIHRNAPEKGLTVIQYPESGTSLRAREDIYKLALAVEQAL
jgi:chromosome partitioning protein